MITLTLAASAFAADLAPNTLTAWQSYIQKVETRSRERIHSGHFLWLDEDAGRAERLKNGEVEIAPFAEGGFTRVSGGLIHDWLGAIFLPNTRLDDVLTLLNDYNRYRDIYGPEVHARFLSHVNGEDEFSMKIVNKVLFVNAGVDMLCRSQTVRLDERHAYSISRTIQVREIQDYGKANERELPPDSGDGFIWRLHSVSRLEQRDGGVYIETERLALTRDIPNSLRFMIAPVVRRLSHNSMAASLLKTRDADQSLMAASKRDEALLMQAPTAAKSFAAR